MGRNGTDLGLRIYPLYRSVGRCSHSLTVSSWRWLQKLRRSGAPKPAGAWSREGTH